VPKYRVSPFDKNEIENLRRSLSGVLDFPMGDLEQIYKDMCEKFDDEDNPPTKRYEADRNVFFNGASHRVEFYRNAAVIGVDLPIAIQGDQKNGKTIVIVGQDPLRKTKNPNLDIGTPYEVHRHYGRIKARHRLYFQHIKLLLDEGYRVYLTDVAKVWVGEMHGVVLRPRTLHSNDHRDFLRVLKAEIGNISPFCVLTWGAKAKDAIKDLALDDSRCPHYSSPHPAARSSDWEDILQAQCGHETRATNEAKLRYWQDMLQRNLVLPSLSA